MFSHLEIADIFRIDGDGDSPTTFAPAATLKEEEIPSEGEQRPYTQSIELEKFSEARFGKAVASFSWDDQLTVPHARTIVAELAITRTEIVEENGERIAKAYDASGKLVAEKLLY